MATTPIKLSALRAASPATTPLNDADIFHLSQGASPADSVGVVLSEIATYLHTMPLTVAEKTDNYTLVLGDADNTLISMNKGTAVTLTIPLNAAVAFPVGTVIPIASVGVGQTTIGFTSGVTLRTPETYKLRLQYSAASIVQLATDEWLLVGDLEAL